jgi:hypothetical protein
MEEGGFGYVVGDWVRSGEKCVVLPEPGEFFEISVGGGVWVMVKIVEG